LVFECPGRFKTQVLKDCSDRPAEVEHQVFVEHDVGNYALGFEVVAPAAFLKGDLVGEVVHQFCVVAGRS
jgi:hypothetical protein